MNDADVLTKVEDVLTRDSFGNPRMSQPAEAIINRVSESRRGRRLIAGAIAALMAAAGTGLALTTLSGGSTGHQVDLKLAAWTVRTQANGTLTLNLVDMSESAAVSEVPEVRAALAQAGVPAEVTFGSECTSSASLPESVTMQVLPPSPAGELAPYPSPSGFSMVVVPSEMPPDTKLNVSIDPVPTDHQVIETAPGVPHFQTSAWLEGARVVPTSAVITCQAAQS